MKLTIKDLTPASYNPRQISESRLAKLESSIDKFGDLSGVVFNLKTRTLVSGHQRLKVLKKYKTNIQVTKKADDTGTVGVGEILAKDKTGKIVLSVPIRLVSWSDKKTEMAANVAANAHGGDFDTVKLQKVLAKLKKGSFDIEVLGLNFRLPELPKKGDEDQSEDEVNEGLNLDDLRKDLKHKCPKCGFKF